MNLDDEIEFEYDENDPQTKLICQFMSYVIHLYVKRYSLNGEISNVQFKNMKLYLKDCMFHALKLDFFKKLNSLDRMTISSLEFACLQLLGKIDEWQ